MNRQICLYLKIQKLDTLQRGLCFLDEWLELVMYRYFGVFRQYATDKFIATCLKYGFNQNYRYRVKIQESALASSSIKVWYRYIISIGDWLRSSRAEFDSGSGHVITKDLKRNLLVTAFLLDAQHREVVWIKSESLLASQRKTQLSFCVKYKKLVSKTESVFRWFSSESNLANKELKVETVIVKNITADHKNPHLFLWRATFISN